MAGKTDNGDLESKLALRRHLLRKYHADVPLRVLDCCQGSGILWGRLRLEFTCSGYLGMDLKAKKGRLKLDSARYLGLPGWDHDVLDIDTYGSPWGHWDALLPRLRGPTTVFLTIGQWQMETDRRILDALGIGGMKVPPGIAIKLHGIAVSYCLTRGCVETIIREVVEAVSTVSKNARYLGVRLEPGKSTCKGD